MSYRAEELFASTASYCARYRPGYAPALIEHLMRRFDLDHDQRVLDIGTGTGVLALGLASYVGEVVAVDPEPGMLSEARRLAAQRAVTNVDWRQGDSTTIPGMGLGTFRVATFGQSFHWTDRPRMLADLDGMIDDQGGVDVEVIGWDWTLTRTVEELVGLQFSYSFSSPAQLGPNKAAFEQDVREALTGGARPAAEQDHSSVHSAALRFDSGQ